MYALCDAVCGCASDARGVVDVTGLSSGSSKTTSYSVMKSEKTGAGIFKVGENTMPTDQLVS